MGMTIDECIEILTYPTQYFPSKREEALDFAMDTIRKYQQLEDFAKWVAEEVIDEEPRPYNHLAFEEIACRKLVQLGIIQESDGEYSYEVVEDGDDD